MTDISYTQCSCGRHHLPAIPCRCGGPVAAVDTVPDLEPKQPYKRRPRGPNELEKRVREKMQSPGQVWIYEGLRLPIMEGTARYTCDWLVICDYQSPMVVECKSAGHRHPSHNRAQLAFTAAEAEYGGVFKFYWIED